MLRPSSLRTAQDDDKKPSKAARDGKPAPRKAAAPTAIVKSKLRGEGREIDGEAINRRKNHQKELAEKRQESGMEKYAEDGGGAEAREKQWRRFESYSRENQLPEAVASQKVRFSFPFSVHC